MRELLVNFIMRRKEAQVIENALFNHINYLEGVISTSNNTYSQQITESKLKLAQELYKTFNEE